MISNSKKGLDLLPEFQKFLLDRKLTPENRTSFFAYWVTRYLSFARKQQISPDDYQEESVIAFLGGLRADPRIKDWQARQADDALRLYYFHYLGKSRQQASGTALTNVEEALKEISRVIRSKHYSYSTERTYIQWANRFFDYILETDKKAITDFSSEDIRNFLTHLAIKE